MRGSAPDTGRGSAGARWRHACLKSFVVVECGGRGKKPDAKEGLVENAKYGEGAFGDLTFPKPPGRC